MTEASGISFYKNAYVVKDIPSLYHLLLENCNDAQVRRNKLFMLPMSIS
jgi:hypothetical protein